MKIDVLCSCRNHTVIRDRMTGYIWLYSYNNPIAYYDGQINLCKDNLTVTNKRHIAVFKEFLKNF